MLNKCARWHRALIKLQHKQQIQQQQEQHKFLAIFESKNRLFAASLAFDFYALTNVGIAIACVCFSFGPVFVFVVAFLRDIVRVLVCLLSGQTL